MSKLIDKQIVSAIREKINFGGGNTTVTTDSKGIKTRVYLHGNLVAEINHITKTAKLMSCGWKTYTTKSRLNRVLEALNLNCGICQRNRKWYVISNNKDLHDFYEGMTFSLK